MTTELPKKPKAYSIRHKLTKVLWVARSGKSVWRQPGHAKNAWRSSGVYRSRNCYFDDQDEYEIVELTNQSESLLERAVTLLKLCQGQVEYTMEQEIELFLIDVEKGE